MLALRFAALVFGGLLVTNHASAQNSTKNGTIPTDTSGDEMGTVFHNNGWNTGGFFCQVGSLIVWPESGPCASRQVVINFSVLTGGGVTAAEHQYVYHVFCGSETGNRIRHEIAFDGASFTAIDNGTFTFNLSGGDTIRLVTTEGVIVPSLRPVWYIGLVLVLLTVGTLMFRRRWRRVAGT